MNENKSEKTALLVMDVQPGILGRLENKDEYLAKVVKAVDFAHEKGIPVIYVVVGFRPGMPEVSLRNKSFGAIASMPPAPTMAKRRWSAGRSMLPPL